MRALLFALAASALLAPGLISQESKPSEPKSIALRVLYTGAPDHPRTKDFVAFLEKTFSKVGAMELSKLDAAAAADYDVVIVDAPSGYPADDGESFKFPKAPRLDPWTKPTVLMGAAGGSFLQRRNLKLDWL